MVESPWYLQVSFPCWKTIILNPLKWLCDSLLMSFSDYKPRPCNLSHSPLLKSPLWLMPIVLNYLPTCQVTDLCSTIIGQEEEVASWPPLGLVPTVLYIDNSKSILLPLKTLELWSTESMDASYRDTLTLGKRLKGELSRSRLILDRLTLLLEAKILRVVILISPFPRKYLRLILTP